VGLPLQVMVDDDAANVPPVFVMEDPAAMVNVVDAEVKMPPRLLFIGAGLPVSATVEPELVVMMPVFVIEPPAATVNADPETVIVPVLFIGDG